MKKKTLIVVVTTILLLLVLTTIVRATAASSDNTLLVTTAEENETENITETENVIETENTTASDNQTKTNSELEDELEQAFNVKLGDYFEANENISLTKSVSGNAFLMAREVSLTGNSIVGDAFIMGQNVTIDTATINGNLFVMAQNITITGKSNIFQLYAACAEISVSPETNIAVDTKIAAGHVSLAGSYGHNVDIAGDKIIIDEQAIIGGKLEYSSQKEANIPETAEIAEVKFNFIDTEKAEEVAVATTIIEKITNCIITFATIAVLGLLVVFVGKKLEHTIMSSTIGESIWKAYVYGLVAFLCILPLVLLMFTGILSIAALVVLLSLFTLSFFSVTAGLTHIVILVFQQKIEEKKITAKGIYARLLLFGLVYSLITLIPFIGGLVTFIITTLGFGTTIRSVFFRDKKTEK